MFVFAIIAALLVIAATAWFFYFVYTPPLSPPELKATVTSGTMNIDGHERSYQAVIPIDLPTNPALLIMFHGTGQDARSIRKASGYGFDVLAVERGFIVVYPNAYKGAWRDARKVGDNPARRENIDDEAFVRELISYFRQSNSIDRSRVFAAGFSNGGQMIIRLAATMPETFAGLAAIGATQPTVDNFAVSASISSVPMLLVAGTRDPIVPYNGGIISLWGFSPRGSALSVPDTAGYFAKMNGITTSPTVEDLPHSAESGDSSVFVTRYRQNGHASVELYTVINGGHVFPNPRYAAPRIAGFSTHDLDTPRVVWSFFEGLPDRTSAGL
jgi:polyhydroxybutyrate depolymerase